MKFQGAFKIFEFDPKKEIKDGSKFTTSNFFTMSQSFAKKSIKNFNKDKLYR